MRLIDRKEIPCRTCKADICVSRCEKFLRWLGGSDDSVEDVVSVKHGKWGHVEHGTMMMYSARCNICSHWAYSPAIYENLPFLDFCPNCGAKMDGGAE